MRLVIIALAALTAAACSEAPRGEPVEVVLPDWSKCMAGFDNDVDALFQAIDQGDPDAMLCSLALDEGRGLERDEREMLYRWYRATGQEPSGLHESISRLSPHELAVHLDSIHRWSAELDPFEIGFWGGCTVYDPVALELIRRVQNACAESCAVDRPWRPCWLNSLS